MSNWMAVAPKLGGEPQKLPPPKVPPKTSAHEVSYAELCAQTKAAFALYNKMAVGFLSVTKKEAKQLYVQQNPTPALKTRLKEILDIVNKGIEVEKEKIQKSAVAAVTHFVKDYLTLSEKKPELAKTISANICAQNLDGLPSHLSPLISSTLKSVGTYISAAEKEQLLAAEGATTWENCALVFQYVILRLIVGSLPVSDKEFPKCSKPEGAPCSIGDHPARRYELKHIKLADNSLMLGGHRVSAVFLHTKEDFYLVTDSYAGSTCLLRHLKNCAPHMTPPTDVFILDDRVDPGLKDHPLALVGPGSIKIDMGHIKAKKNVQRVLAIAGDVAGLPPVIAPPHSSSTHGLHSQGMQGSTGMIRPSILPNSIQRGALGRNYGFATGNSMFTAGPSMSSSFSGSGFNHK